MTVTYTAQVATSSFGCFLRLLLRWRGSIYKLMWKEFIIFSMAYYILNLVYRFALNDDQKRVFERVSRYCEAYNNLIPLAFVLGFYVSIVITRWWDQFMLIPWPDRMAMFVTANVQGHDERGRLMRRTIMRYLCLAYVITMSSISPVVRKRFPTFQHMTETGFMLPNEQKIMEEIQTPHNKYFVPLAWASSLVTRSRKENRIKDDFAVKTLIDEINAYRGQLGGLFNYDYISIPLVYTQVVTLAVYTFFLSCLMGRQFVEKGGLVEDMYIPIFTFLQFFFYMGWLKVAESLVNPFGEDDDDFDINTVIDRNLQVSYLVVDEMHAEHPELIKDQYWDEVDFEPAYTAASACSRNPEPYLGSAFSISVEPHEAEFIPMGVIDEGDELTDIITRPSSIPQRLKASLSRRNVSSNTSLNLKLRTDSYGTSPQNRSHFPYRRSTSRGSHGSVAGGSKKTSRLDSMSSQNSQSGQTSPITNRDPDDIFTMSDIDVSTGSTTEIAGAARTKHAEDILALLNQHCATTTPAADKQQQQPQQTSATAPKQRDRHRSGLSEVSQTSTLKNGSPNGDVEEDEDLEQDELHPILEVHARSAEALGQHQSVFQGTGTPKDSPDLTKRAKNSSKKRPNPSPPSSARLPQSLVDAAEDLKLKKEKTLGMDNVPRSISVAGEDVSHDLKLQVKPLDPRTRTVSEGPRTGIGQSEL